MASNKREFRQQVLVHLQPYLEGQGFRKWQPSGRREVPVVYFERYRQGKRDLLDIQFDKYGRLAFFVNLASVKGDQIETMFEGLFPVTQVSTDHLHQGCRLRGGMMSQSIKPPFLSRFGAVGRAAKGAAMVVIRHFKEVEAWFEDGSIGPHILVYTLR